jgi:hypothetical protein
MKKTILLTCLHVSTALLFSLQSMAQPANYYVATAANGGNDANAGTSLAAPFATIAKAFTKAVIAGDTIFVRSGTYPNSFTVRPSKSGIAGNPIVLTVYKPDMVNANSRPVFDFSAMVVNSNNRGFQVSENYWHIYGIIVKGAGDNGMNLDGASYCKIEFCDFTRNRDAGIQLGGGSSFDSLINCDSYQNADLGTGTTTEGGNADGFSPKLDVGDSIYLRGCRSWLNSDDGYDGYMRPTGGVSWTLEDCWSFRNGYYWLDGTTTDQENGMGFKTGGSDDKNLAHNCTLIRCLSFENKGHGFDQNSNAGSIYIYNGSAYNNVENDYYMTSPNVVYATGATLVLENDLSLGPQGVSLPSASTSTRSLVTATNSFSKNTTSPEILSFDTTGVTSMRSVDGSLPVLNFMHLNTAAPQPFTYIDKGTVLSNVVYHGALGVPYNGAAPDLGAFESSYGITVGTTYIFTGSGNWTDSTNWQQNLVPPASLPANDTISINGTGSCILNTSETILPGGTLIVQPNKQLIVQNNLAITQ